MIGREVAWLNLTERGRDTVWWSFSMELQNKLNNVYIETLKQWMERNRADSVILAIVKLRETCNKFARDVGQGDAKEVKWISSGSRWRWWWGELSWSRSWRCCSNHLAFSSTSSGIGIMNCTDQYFMQAQLLRSGNSHAGTSVMWGSWSFRTPVTQGK